MTPTRPYFFRALYAWIVDNDCTPYVAVDAMGEGVSIPEEYIQDGEVILNMAPAAIIDLEIDDEWVTFKARFNGVSREIFIPMPAVLGLYAKENGQGMLFPDEPAYHEDETSSDSQTGTPDISAVSLKQDAPEDKTGSAEDDMPPPDNNGGKPNLRIVK